MSTSWAKVQRLGSSPCTTHLDGWSIWCSPQQRWKRCCSVEMTFLSLFQLLISLIDFPSKEVRFCRLKTNWFQILIPLTTELLGGAPRHRSPIHSNSIIVVETDGRREKERSPLDFNSSFSHPPSVFHDPSSVRSGYSSIGKTFFRVCVNFIHSLSLKFSTFWSKIWRSCCNDFISLSHLNICRIHFTVLLLNWIN